MKKVNIFIDHAWSTDSDDGKFAIRIKDRLKTIKGDYIVTTFGDLSSEPQNWKSKTTEAYQNADIIIPIISGDFMSFVEDEIEKEINKIIESDDKYLFPILFKPTDWANHSWLVKSKIIPESNIPITELEENDTEKIINNLVKTVYSVITSIHKPAIEKKTITNTKQKKLENIVFISHDHDDADFAELLKLQLEKEGIIGWIDSERLKIGQDWREEIDTSITSSLAVIVIMTPEARKSEYVTYEWSFAWGKNKKIFPVMLKQTQLHPRLESLQYLDFTKRISRPYEDLIKSIKDLIK